MTTFAEYVRGVLEEKVKRHNPVVFYDATRGKLFRPVLQNIGDMLTPRWDAEADPIEARRGMAKAVRQGDDCIFLYVPYAAPQTDEEKRDDAWAAYAAIGTAFPSKPSEEYEELARACYENKVDEIHQLFVEKEGEPSFEELDLVGNSSGKWPTLRLASGKETRSDLLRWVLTTGDVEKLHQAVKDLTDFASDTLGLKISPTVDPLEMQRLFWERVLLTDYLAGFGEALPEKLLSMEVKAAPADHRPMIVEMLDSVRRDSMQESLYCRRSDEIADRLKLDALTKDITDLTGGTFRFQERRSLKKAVEALTRLDKDGAVHCQSFAKSVWASEEGPSLEWMVVKQAIDYLEQATKIRTSACPSPNSFKTLIEQYVNEGSLLDAAMRKLELAFETCRSGEGSATACDSTDFDVMRATLIADYRALCARRQKAFAVRLQSDGWPAMGVMDNAVVFDELIAPKLQVPGRAVAFIIADGLRYELGALLAQKMQSLHPKLQPACAHMPTETQVGKATLLPSGKDIVLKKTEEGKVLPELNGRPLPGLQDRLSYLKACYGERFQEMTASDFLSGKKRLNEKTALLLLRNDDIDGVLENNQPGLLHSVNTTINELVRLVNRLRSATKVHFTDIVIAADHGFVLNYEPEDSDVCQKPEGNWINVHDRMLLGSTSDSSSTSLILPAAQLGIHGDFEMAAVPLGLCAYRSGSYYFHGGASLEEAVVPVITMQLAATIAKAAVTGGKVKMQAKRPRFTTLITRITVSDPEGHMEGGKPTLREVELQICEAGDRTNKSVGSVYGDEANRVTLDSNEETEVKIMIDKDVLFIDSEESVKKVLVRALDPESRVQVGEVRFEVEQLL